MSYQNLIIMGPPGAGKGTQSEKIVAELNIPHISTGDMFREAIASNSELGKLAASYINQGNLVPDDITIALVKERLSRDDCSSGYLLDGFPRTLAQAEALKKLSNEISRPVELVIDIDIDIDSLIDRISGRRVCLKCGNSYHTIFKKTQVDGICDGCGETLIQRKDDTKESLDVRLHAYEKQTKPLIEYYSDLGLIARINGQQEINEVFEDILLVLKGEHK